MASMDGNSPTMLKDGKAPDPFLVAEPIGPAKSNKGVPKTHESIQELSSQAKAPILVMIMELRSNLLQAA